MYLFETSKELKLVVCRLFSSKRLLPELIIKSKTNKWQIYAYRPVGSLPLNTQQLKTNLNSKYKEIFSMKRKFPNLRLQFK